MIGSDAPIDHDFFKIWIQEAITYIEKYSEQDHTLGEQGPSSVNKIQSENFQGEGYSPGCDYGRHLQR